MTKTVVIGASADPSRYSYLACQMLRESGVEFVPVGKKRGEVLGESMLDIRDLPAIADVHTITMYISATHQKEWYDYFLSLKPKRIIFNPGSENAELSSLAKKEGIETVQACSLVLLRTGQF